MAEFYPSAPTSDPDEMTVPDFLLRRPPLTTVYTTTGQRLSYIYVLYERIMDFMENDEDIVSSDCSLYIRSGNLIDDNDDFTLTLTYANGDDLINTRLLSLFNSYSILNDTRIGRTLRRIVFE